jgi:hypothetical protein
MATPAHHTKNKRKQNKKTNTPRVVRREDANTRELYKVSDMSNVTRPENVRFHDSRNCQMSQELQMSRFAKIQGYFITSWWAVIYDVPKVHSKIKKPLPVALGW